MNGLSTPLLFHLLRKGPQHTGDHTMLRRCTLLHKGNRGLSLHTKGAQGGAQRRAQGHPQKGAQEGAQGHP